MTMTRNTVTIAGNIGNDPVFNTTPTGLPVLNFRVASSSGRWDRQSGAWVEGVTSWYAVSAFRNLAEHARASLHRGDPVIVTGTLQVKEWENDVRKGVNVDVVADAIGHDLNRGTSAFVRRAKDAPAASAGPDPLRHTPPVPFEPSLPDEPTGHGESHLPDDVSEEDRDAWNVHGLLPPAGDAHTSADERAFA